MPVVVGACQKDAVAAGPFGHAVGARAHRLRGGLRGSVRVQDDGWALAQAKQQVGVGSVQRECDGARVGCGNGGDVVEQRLARLVGGARRHGALKAEAHRGRIQGLAVVKAHARTQPEGVAQPAGVCAPGLGQQRADRAVFLDLGQALQHVVVRDLAHGGRRGHGGVQAVGLDREADHHAGAPGAGLRRHRTRQGARAQRQAAGEAVASRDGRRRLVGGRHGGRVKEGATNCVIVQKERNPPYPCPARPCASLLPPATERH